MPRAAPPSPDSKRAHLCPVCQKTFTTSGHLLRHSKVHTGEKKHKCPFPGCETTCSRQDNLQQHYRIHLSQGSRRSPSTLLANSTARENPRFSTPSLPTSPQVRSSLLDRYTVVDGPPILHPLDTIDAPSPPNTPPPLVPASPHLVLQYHLRQQASRRSHSGSDLIEASIGHEYPMRPLSSSSSSSSSTLSPPPSFQRCNRSAPSTGELTPAYSQPIWFADEVDPHKNPTFNAPVYATPISFNGTGETFKTEFIENEECFAYTPNAVSFPQHSPLPFELPPHDSFQSSNFSIGTPSYNPYAGYYEGSRPNLPQMPSHPYELYTDYSYTSVGVQQHMPSGVTPINDYRFQNQQLPTEEIFLNAPGDYPLEFW